MNKKEKREKVKIKSVIVIPPGIIIVNLLM